MKSHKYDKNEFLQLCYDLTNWLLFLLQHYYMRNKMGKVENISISFIDFLKYVVSMPC